ncbi:MAG: NAD(P)-dependent oxidoreductase [Flavobacterium sp.]|uniref:NAD-dependent epimerase/dehydratase family protein n=1 Tax=Flavobacterium sp. TaxID=239 RepID=UPI0027325A28|nr:NAD(P)-dependent oxidoreductase [Flavobacterium sp.]MDP3679590.1 NAD(P)-dependent oxidoreductase [Flavobacterium sp.]MDZ4330590.1 NAD(P)-dependent oxidoreductase [Flavobacterium sp.]
MKILITGIKGFLGINLIERLDKHEVFGLGTKEETIGKIQVFNSNDLDKLDQDFDLVIISHAAVESGTTTLSNESLFNVNVSLTERIIYKFKNAFIIYISTTSVYDFNFDFITETSNINPQSNYSLSKLWGEKIVSINKKTVILRLSSMYGIGMKENTLIPNYVNQALNSGIIEVWGKGDRLQNYVHVDDVVQYIDLIIQNKENLYGKILLGVSKKQYSNLEIANIILNYTKGKIKFVNEDNSKSFCYNNNYTRNLLNWESQVEIEDRLKKYIEWKKKY